ELGADRVPAERVDRAAVDRPPGRHVRQERLLVAVLALLCAGTVISAVASSLTLMLVGRIVQGAAGGIFPLAFGIIRDEFPRERVAAAVGIMAALAGAGGGLGVVLAGPIVDSLSFHYLFWLPLIPLA